MEGLDLTSIYTTIGGVLGTPAAIDFDKKRRDSTMLYDRQIPDAPVTSSMLPVLYCLLHVERTGR